MTDVRDHDVVAAQPPPDRRGGDLLRTGLRGLGQVLITLGLVVLLFVVYELFVTDLFTAVKQGQRSTALREQWNAADDPLVAGPDLPAAKLGQLPLGQGFAFIRIPAFGLDYVKVILEGTKEDELVEGPGHYVGTALPGQVGNFALAGHRVGKGSPFLNLDRLAPGDPIVIETSDTWYVYRVLGDPASGDLNTDPAGIPGQEIVAPSATEVIAPVPGDPAATPTRALLTLTTCQPKFSDRQRLIVHAELDGPGLPKAAYPEGPPALREG